MLEQIFRSQELSSEAYHAERDHESSSNLKSMLVTPAHYLHQVTEPSKSTDAFQIGTVLHAAILEPEVFDERYVVVPKCDRRTSAGKQAYQALLEQHPGKTLIPAEDVGFINKLRQQIHRTPDVHKMLALPGENEASIFWVDDETGIKLKIRPDRHFFINGELFYLSLKSASNASKESFAYDIDKYDYHMAEAMYADGLEQAYNQAPNIIWLVFEKDTWQITKFQPCATTMAIGHERYRRAVKLLKQCRDRQEFIGYQGANQIEEISLPDRAIRRARTETGLSF